MTQSSPKLRMGMVGGGTGAFIGAIHRIAAQLDNEIELVCGAFNSSAAASLESGLALGLDTQRCYPDYLTMMKAEASLPAEQAMHFVCIVTPNHLHFPVAQAAIDAGFDVICDKPATFNLAQALALKALIDQHQTEFALTHTYTGYPLVKEARARLNSGEIGKLVKVIVEYSQGWLASADIEANKQAAWRLNPEFAGSSCCVGDIGIHAADLLEYMCQDEITEVCAILTSSQVLRQLDDDATIALKLKSGARGLLIASQISIGEENNLSIRVYGDQGSLHWRQEEPNTLLLKKLDGESNLIRTGVGQRSPISQAACRTPAGHPEGYIEAFANIYRSFAAQLRGKHFGVDKPDDMELAPDINAGIRSMAFIESVVAASASSTKWHPILSKPRQQETI